MPSVLVVADKGDVVAVYSKVGCQHSVLREDDRARIVAVAVLPLHEMVAVIRCGSHHLHQVRRLGVCGCPNRVVVHVGGEADEDGGQHGVLSQGEGNGIVGAAVAPTQEVVVGIGDGGEGDRGEVVVAAPCRGDGASAVVVRHAGGGVLVGGEAGGEDRVLRHHHTARVAAVAVVPLGEVVAVVGGGAYPYRRVIVHRAAAAGGALGGVGGVDPYGVAVDGEMGCQRRVACHGDGTRVVLDAVVPHREVVVRYRHCRQRHLRQVVVAAATCGAAQRDVAAVGGDKVAVVVELRRVLCRVGHHHRARVLRVAVLPLHEVVAVVGRGRQGGGAVVVVGAAAAHAAHGAVVAGHAHGIAVDGELGRIGGVLRHRHQAWVVGVAVAPLGEVVARVGQGGDVHRREVVVRAAAAGGADGGIAALHGDDIAVYLELGGIGGVVQHRHVRGLSVTASLHCVKW